MVNVVLKRNRKIHQCNNLPLQGSIEKGICKQNLRLTR